MLALTGLISLIAAGYAAAGMFDLQLDESEDGPKSRQYPSARNWRRVLKKMRP